ncbi:MAG: phosphoribosylformylglycinamidine synthase [Christensenellales bacterium]
MIKRVFSLKKEGFDPKARILLSEIRDVLNIQAKSLKIFNRYDIQGLDEEFQTAVDTIFSEKPVDYVFLDELPQAPDCKYLVVEFLPGQYDQRADSAMQCIELLTQKARPFIKCATVYCIEGIDQKQYEKIKNYLINPVECREGSMQMPQTLEFECRAPRDVETVEGFIDYDKEQLKEYYESQSFAMTFEDLLFIQSYFEKEKRNPTITELKVIDTYWSDHCRHTTFLTELMDIAIDSDNPHLNKALELYEELFEEINGDKKEKYKCLMDIATIAAKKLRKDGVLDNLDISDEINACSVEVEVDNDGLKEDWLIMFKNETHNHPTEIEPYGGAATCLGGAIRDPLSGRAYVYQGMRVTGAADPTEPIENTLKGKLPQRVLSKVAAEGFSSYGNQIGVPTGIVNEIYHPRYKAKRMEAGYVIGGVPKANVVRQKPKAGDIVLIVGGETGRDGCGGATSSSKAHNEDSIHDCGAEVQKGDPLIERRLLRLFKRADVAPMIIKCNDFGAGGVSVAVGELADSLDIYLDKVPQKYPGLNGTELAISESQERMAVVIHKSDLEKFIELCAEENLNAVNIAEVTTTGRMRMFFNGKTIVDIKREFLNTNGVKQISKALIYDKSQSVLTKENEELIKTAERDIKEAVLKDLSSLNACSQKGIVDMFDSTIGASSIFVPLGGKYQLTPSLVMASKPPVSGETNTATVSTFACPIELLEISPFNGAIYSIILSINKLVASGVGHNTIRLSLQEFFKKLRNDPRRWGEVTSALLGALYAQYNLGLAAIGGKDSMSGSFNEMDVPPTLISFAMGIGRADTLISNVFKKGQKLFRIKLKRDKDFIPDFKYLIKLYNILNINIEKGNIEAATVVERCVMTDLIKSLVGEGSGISFARTDIDLFMPSYGDFIVAIKDIEELPIEDVDYLGIVDDSGAVKGNDFTLTKEEIRSAYTSRLEKVFPIIAKAEGEAKAFDYIVNETYKCKTKVAKPRVFIPVFPGTNCEYDTTKRFKLAGAETDIVVVKNLVPGDIKDTIERFKNAIRNSQIIAFPGGASGGNQPDGSGKFIATTFRNPVLVDALYDLFHNRDGLILGIDNGFQALVKLGLLPYGKIKPHDENSPTITYNDIGRHVSTIANIRVCSNLSPWLSSVKVGDIFSVPISNVEGKFIASPSEMQRIVENGQIATQYVDLEGNVTMIPPYNPTGSMQAIEGITSPDGRIFGKMGHAERIGPNLYKNLGGEFDMKIFESGIMYFQ